MTLARAHRSNEDWVADLTAGGSAGDDALLELRRNLVAGLTSALGTSPSHGPLIEDSIQEGMILILQRLHTFRGDSGFVTWAMAIVIRKALTEMRRARWRDVSLDEMSEAGRIAPATSEPLVTATYERARLMDAVRNAIDSSLTDKQRAAIQAELAGAPPDEIAARMGTTRNALYKLVYDGRARLKQAIVNAGWSHDQVRSVLGGA